MGTDTAEEDRLRQAFHDAVHDVHANPTLSERARSVGARRRRVRAAVGAVGVAATVGLGWSLAGQLAPTPTRAAAPAGPTAAPRIVTATTAANGVAEVASLGVLSVNARGCLVGNPQSNTLMVWPRGYALGRDAAGVTVTDPSRRVVAHVDQALFAGGTPVRQADATCGTSHAFLINSVADIKAPHLLLSKWKNGDDAMLALGNGTLVAQDDGCVGMRPDGGGKPVVLRWPAGTRLAPDGTAVVGESGKRIEFGQRTGFGGGFSGAKLPNECSAARWGGVYEVQQPL